MCKKLCTTLAVTAVAAAWGLPPAAAPAFEIPFVGDVFGRSDADSADANHRPGGREWWRTHKKKAMFVPGKGYQVEGVEGYFGADGVPMDAPVDEQTIRLIRESSEGGLLPGLDPKKAAARVRDAAGYGPNEAAARRLLDEGVALFNDKRYGPAATKFEAAASRWPGTDLAAKSLFNLGEARFFDRKYKPASDAYIELLDKHSSTPRLDDAIERMWSIARYWEKHYFETEWRPPMDANPIESTRPSFDTIGHAIRLYDAIRLNDPTGPRADDAIMATASIHFRRRHYNDADYHYTLLREEYPRSEHQFEAHLLGLRAKLQRYYGPDYDGTPLKQAERLEEQTRRVFAGRLSDEEKERLRDVRAQLAASIDERALRMVDYYENTDHHGAARYYLANLIRERPDSPAAEKARTKLAELEGKPAVPEERLGWLVSRLPENPQYEKINGIVEVGPAATAPAGAAPGEGGTMIAEGPGPDGPTTTR